MRTLMMILALATSTSALAEGGCAYPFCGGIQAAVDESLAEAGLSEADGYTFHQDERGQGWLTILSTDAKGLDRVAPRSGARTLPISDTDSYARTVPMDLTDIDVIQIPGTKYGDITLKRGTFSGTGGGSDECYESCVCTETGVECWLECP